MASDVSKNLGAYEDGASGYGSHVNDAVMALLTNKSGGSVVTGDVLVADTTTDAAFTTTTTAGDDAPVYVVPQSISGDDVAATKTILNNEAGWVYRGGSRVPAVAVDGAVSRLEYLKTSGTAKKLTGTGVIAGAGAVAAGACAVALEAAGAAGNIAALLLPPHVAESSTVLSSVVSDLETMKVQGRDLRVNTTAVTVVNTTTETDLLNYAIPANYLLADTQIIVEIPVRLKNTTGSSQTITIRARLGASSVSFGIAMSAPANTYYSLVRVTLFGKTSATQNVLAQLLGMPVNINSMAGGGVAALTEDMTNAVTLRVTAQHGVANANLEIGTYGYRVSGPHKDEVSW